MIRFGNYILLILLGLGKVCFSQEEIKINDLLNKTVVLWMPDYPTSNLSGLSQTLNDITEIQQATFVAGAHQCLILTLSENRTYLLQYHDLLKRLSTAYPFEAFGLKNPKSNVEIFANSSINDQHVLKE